MGDRSKPSRNAIDDVFGEAIPRVSGDERDVATPDDDAERERWMRENRPPHHN
ncbi:hypothetical protein [Mycobacterium sp. GA-1285]|uniref:hypothetical protein n=1 Tax=Mycobacterium sp. GA-1285 TaxID=1772282 RepID=UPI000AB4315B|nr:hypothetical protein [Mycobacterium sp. GA-1285]